MVFVGKEGDNAVIILKEAKTNFLHLECGGAHVIDFFILPILK